MKFQLKNTIAVIALVLVLSSCTKEDAAPTGYGTLNVEFDNVYGSADFAFATNYTNSNSEVVKATSIKYIVSNIILTKADGTTFTYPKAQSYFIVDEATAATQILKLSNIPAGDYTSVKFGIGVDKAQWELGATGQGDFLATAQTAGMMWSWTGGYKFLSFEGTFTSPTVTTASNYRVHTGKVVLGGVETYNYAEISLSLPSNALVRTTITPVIHILADVKKVLDGTNKIALSNAAGGDIMGGSNLALITANLANMFTVAHVHND
jgi:hypothetical protein